MVSLMDVFVIAVICSFITAVIIFSVTKKWLLSLIEEGLLPIARDVDSIIDTMCKEGKYEKIEDALEY